MGLAEMERWLADTKRAVDAARPYVPDSELTDVDHLIEHGEPLIGLSMLAHAIVENGLRVPRTVIDHIRESVTGTSEEPFLPDRLEEHVLRDQ